MATIGTLYGIGIGPGDPDLITLKGLKILQKVAVVALPTAQIDRAGTAEMIVQEFLRPDQHIMRLVLPFITDRVAIDRAWQDIAVQIYATLAQGIDIAFVAEGDISFYSTFSYLLSAIASYYPQVPIVAIPGVSSPFAAAATLGMPLTLWDDRLVVLPILHHLSELNRALDSAEVVVLMKVHRYYRQVWQVLEKRDLLRHSHVVTYVTTPSQKIWSDLTSFGDLQLPYFSLLIVRQAN